MQMNARPALPQRIGRLLRAKEFLVFYAIGLGLLDIGAPLATGWLFRHRSLATLLGTGNTVVGDAAVRPRRRSDRRRRRLPARVGLLHRRLPALAAGPAALGPARRAAVRQALRAHRPDRRDLVGPRRPGRRDERPSGKHGVRVLLFVVQTLVFVPLLYAEYAIVASNVGVGRALARSAQTFAANAFVSLLSCSCSSRSSLRSRGFCPRIPGRALALGPAVLIHVLVWGCVSFLSDVVLLSVYIDSIERGTIPPN